MGDDSTGMIKIDFIGSRVAGVFVRNQADALQFHEFDEPSPEQVANVAGRTAKRVIKLLEAGGKSFDSELSNEEANDFVQRQPALASLYAAAARGGEPSGKRADQATMRLIQKDSHSKTEPHAVVFGINIHATVAEGARDKPRMERMCRYLARPPIAQHRLSQREDSSLRYDMKKVSRAP